MAVSRGSSPQATVVSHGSSPSVIVSRGSSPQAMVVSSGSTPSVMVSRGSLTASDGGKRLDGHSVGIGIESENEIEIVTWWNYRENPFIT